MFDVSKFLDRAKAGAGVESDYGLAKKLGVNHSNVSNWRTGRNAPDEATIEKLSAWSGDDPFHVIACIFSMRAANDDAADLWRRMAVRLEKGHAEISALAIVAIVCVAGLSEPARAALPYLENVSSSLYIMLNVALARFAWRMARLAWRQSHAHGTGPAPQAA